jgi:hypothetical protein
MHAPALQPVLAGQQWWLATVVPQQAPLYWDPTHSLQ